MAILASMNLAAICQTLLLLVVANGAPVIAKSLLGRRFDDPVDGGLKWIDNRPLLGPTKTLRGVVVAVIACLITALFLRLDPLVGAAAGVAAMAGDLFSSFLKRRLNIASSGRAVGLDQIPEALLPCLVLTSALNLSIADIVVVTMTFWVGSVVLSPLLHHLGWRDSPH